MWVKKLCLGVNAVIFGKNTVEVGANTALFWAKKVISKLNTLVFVANIAKL